jgi:hypothetical protein
MYAIMVTCRYSGARSELCRVATNPEAVAKAAQQKGRVQVSGFGKNKRRRFLRKYSNVEIIDLNSAPLRETGIEETPIAQESEKT